MWLSAMQVTVLFPRDIFLPVNLWFPLSPQGAPLKAGHRNSGGRTPHYRRGHQCTSQWPKVAAASTHSATTARGAPGQDGPHGNTAFCKRAVHFPRTLGKREGCLPAVQEAEPTGAWRVVASKKLGQRRRCALPPLSGGQTAPAERTPVHARGCRLPCSGGGRCGSRSTGGSEGGTEQAHSALMCLTKRQKATVLF